MLSTLLLGTGLLLASLLSFAVAHALIADPSAEKKNRADQLTIR
jgi:hypothetical protein